ncbi:MAG: hypothetical protein ACFE9R_00440 [Candidatus Hermodarchaeota archaeon]
MPVGLVVMKWDDRVGTEILTKYPTEVAITDKTLMQVYSTHEYSGESGMISLMVGSLNIASYYTGPDKGYYLLLLLNIDDDPDTYEGGLITASRTILENLEDNAYIQMIPSLYRRLSVFPTLTNEQQLAEIYQDEVKRLIIDRLREEGTVSKSELTIWLKDRYKHGFIDLEGVILELIKKAIVKEASVKGMPSELIFLTNDLLVMRIPATTLYKSPIDRGLPSKLSDDYLTEIRKYFQKYYPSEEDNLRISKILSDPQAYEVLKLLRTAIVTKNDLEKLKKKGVEDIDDILRLFWENQMILVFRDDKNTEYYALLTDFLIQLIFPKYLLNVIKSEYNKKSKAEQVLIEYLRVLEDVYLNLKSTAKSRKQVN